MERKVTTVAIISPFLVKSSRVPMKQEEEGGGIG